MRESDATPSVGSEVFQPSLVDRVRYGIAERLDNYLHPVSREAMAELNDVMAIVEGSPLAASIQTLRPEIERGLQNLDRSAVAKNILGEALAVGYGLVRLNATRRALFPGENQQVNRPAVLLGALEGVTSLTLAALLPRVAGIPEKRRIQRQATAIGTYYNTDAGRRAAFGKGTGDGEALTTQVDRIVRRITQDKVPTITGEYHPQPQGA